MGVVSFVCIRVKFSVFVCVLSPVCVCVKFDVYVRVFLVCVYLKFILCLRGFFRVYVCVCVCVKFSVFVRVICA